LLLLVNAHELSTQYKTQNPDGPLGFSLVTPEVEKSNFYKDLERLSEWEFQGKPKAKEKV